MSFCIVAVQVQVLDRVLVLVIERVDSAIRDFPNAAGWTTEAPYSPFLGRCRALRLVVDCDKLGPVIALLVWVLADMIVHWPPRSSFLFMLQAQVLRYNPLFQHMYFGTESITVLVASYFSSTHSESVDWMPRPAIPV